MRNPMKATIIYTTLCLICFAGGFAVSSGLQDLEDEQTLAAIELQERLEYQKIVIDLKVEQEAHVAALKAITKYLNEVSKQVPAGTSY